MWIARPSPSVWTFDSAGWCMKLSTYDFLKAKWYFSTRVGDKDKKETKGDF